MNIKVPRWLPVVVLVLCLVISGAPVAAQSPTVHVVQRGETLSQIARRYGTTVSALVQANGLGNANFIWWGQRLRIPGSASAPSPSTPSTIQGYHVVQRGETLARIAQRYGTTINALVQANGLRNVNFIYVGQRLTIPAGGSTPAPAPDPSVAAPTGGKWIDIDLSSQWLTAYAGDTAVFSTSVSTGLPGTPTPVGRYSIRYKVASTTMSGPGYYLTGVPWVMSFYGGYTIHGTYWHNNFGHPMSRGCVNMRVSEAQWLYNWTPVGTLVVIHW